MTFSCTVRGSNLIWQVNNAQLVTPSQIAGAQAIGIFPEITDNTDGTFSGTLRITVRERNVNMTQIRCLAIGDTVLERNVSNFISLTTFGEFIIHNVSTLCMTVFSPSLPPSLSCS